MILLVLSVGALLIGPTAFALARGRRAFPPLVDGAVVLSITALVGVELWSNMRDGPAVTLLIMTGVGLVGPTLVETALHRIDYHAIEARAHLVTLGLGLVGLGLHAVIDGAALATDGVTRGRYLAAAVALHRIPVGLAVWALLQPSFGTRVAWSGLGVVAGATVVGYGTGPAVLAGFSTETAMVFQALVAGSLLHVIFFRAHTHAH